jgi:hypothetical protein
MPTCARVKLFIRSASVWQSRIPAATSPVERHQEASALRDRRDVSVQMIQNCQLLDSASVSQRCRAQVVASTRFSMTRKILLPASNRGVRKCLD